jgi:hypothetical protein
MMRFIGSIRVAVLVTTALAVGLSGCSTPQSQDVGQAVELPSATVTAMPQVTTAAQQVSGGAWLSGASGDKAATGAFGTWRHAPVAIGGAWDNGDQEQVQLTSICPGGLWSKWNKPLDLAIGAIDKSLGESWAAAAKGSYDARWRQSLTRMKKC